MKRITFKTVLVTGGAGFIGSHLCEALLERGHTVIALDNLFTGSRANLAHLLKNKRFRLIKHDIIKPLPKLPDIHQVYNLACPASPVHYQRDAIATIKANTIGVINVLELAKEKGARVLQASTSEIYGDPLEHPQRESYRGNVSTTGPRACYDEGKRVAETLMSDYHRAHGLDARIARIFNTYGPRMAADDGRIISNFAVQAIAGKPLTLYGDGSQTRSFCYVSDLVRGLMALMEAKQVDGPVNLGNPTELSVRQIAERIIALTGSHSKIVTKPLPEDDPRRRKPDIGRAWQVLHWRPEVALDDGLTRTIGYFREHP